MTAPGCDTHATLGTELRAVAVLLLERARSGSERSGGDRPPQSAAVCASCPVCAVLALLRGERPELAVRLAEHASGLLDVLASALDEKAPEEPVPDPPGRRVQHIRVERPRNERRQPVR